MRTRKTDTTVDSNETTEFDSEKRPRQHRMGKEAPEIKRKMAKSAMNAEPVTEGTRIRSASQTMERFRLVAEVWWKAVIERKGSDGCDRDDFE